MSSILPTDSTLSSASATAPVNQALIPADVRKAGTKAEQLYSQALDFEQVLMQQLTTELNATTGTDGSDDSSDDDGDSDDGSDSSDSTTSMMTQMLPDALAQGMTSLGGVGIARSLYDAMSAEAGIATGRAQNTSTSSVQPETSLAPTDPAALDARNGINWIDR